MMKIQRTALSLILFVLLSLVMTSCAPSGAPTTLNVEMTDFSFNPKEFTIPAGKEITLNLTNKGANQHEFVIMKAGTEVSVPFDANDEDNVYWEAEAAPGEKKSEKFTAPEAGTYQVVCGTPAHIEQGMLGKLTVSK